MLKESPPYINAPTIKIVSILIIIAIAFRIILLLGGVFPFNSDEAVVGLMAKHILMGERPIYFYGQAYMGSLDAYLVAAGFLIFGTKVWVIRFIQLILLIATLCTTALLAYILFRSGISTIYSVAFMVFPTINFTLYTSVSLGGYGEALLIGNLILITGLKISFDNKSCISHVDRTPHYLMTGILGFLVGIGLWTSGLTLVYSIPVIVFLMYKSIMNNRACNGKNDYREYISLIVLIIGGIIGALPIGLYSIDQGVGVLIKEFFGSTMAIEKSPIYIRSIHHLGYFFIFGIPVILGFRPPWEIKWIMIPVMPFVLAFWMGVTVFWMRKIIRKNEQRIMYLMLFSILAIIFIGFVFTSFGTDPTGRYFLPFNIILAIVGGEFIRIVIKKRAIQVLIVGIVGLYNCFGVVNCAWQNPLGLTTQFDPKTNVDKSKMEELISFLEETGEHYGYTNYWVAYPLAFQSKETIIYIPALPYHQDLHYSNRDDRYPPYAEMVKNAKKIAYITSRNPQLEIHLVSMFHERGVSYKTKHIGDYLIYYDLSNRVDPNDQTFH